MVSTLLMTRLTRLVPLAVCAWMVTTGTVACTVYNGGVPAGDESKPKKRTAADSVSPRDAGARPMSDAATDSDAASASACGAGAAGCDASQIHADASPADATVPITDSDSPPIDAAVTGAGGDTATADASAAIDDGATAGAGGAGGASGDNFSPLCTDVPLTAAGAAPAKGGACIASDTRVCYKSCGPRSIGFKTETCNGGKYVEQSGCSFPTTGDYSCYKIPTQIDATCPTSVPRSGESCAVNECVLCNVDGKYRDSSGDSKTGYCVCPAGSSSTSTRKWSCATTNAWPCPNGNGC